MFNRLANTVAEALNRRHLPIRIGMHERRLKEWWPLRHTVVARVLIRSHVRCIRDLRANLQRR